MSFKKFQLNYKIVIEDNDGKIITLQSYEESENKLKSLDEALTAKINISKSNTTTPQQCNVIIYNLNETTRNKIKKSRIYEADKKRTIKVYAGYEDVITLLFFGEIQSAQSNLIGTDFETTIICYNDYAIKNSNINISLTANQDNIIERIQQTMTDVNTGYINKNANNIFHIGKRGRTFQGNSWNILNTANKDYNIFIDNNNLFVMDEKEVRTSDILELNFQSGLLEAPKEYDNYIELKTLFEPLANLNNLVILNSSIKPEYNGNYKLLGFTHDLDIENTGNNSNGTTTLKLQFLQGDFLRVKK